MSFLIDPPWLYATGRAYGRLMPERTPAARARADRDGRCFLATSISLYLEQAVDAADLAAVPRRARPRLDAQLRRLQVRPPPRRAGAARRSAALFATYPLWLRAGRRAAPETLERDVPVLALEAGFALGLQRGDEDWRLASDYFLGELEQRPRLSKRGSQVLTANVEQSVLCIVLEAQEPPQ